MTDDPADHEHHDPDQYERILNADEGDELVAMLAEYAKDFDPIEVTRSARVLVNPDDEEPFWTTLSAIAFGNLIHRGGTTLVQIDGEEYFTESDSAVQRLETFDVDFYVKHSNIHRVFRVPRNGIVKESTVTDDGGVIAEGAALEQEDGWRRDIYPPQG